MKLTSLNSRGFTHYLVVIALVVAVISGVAFWIVAKQSTNKTTASTSNKPAAAQASKTTDQAPAAASAKTTAPTPPTSNNTSSAPKTSSKPKPATTTTTPTPAPAPAYNIVALKMTPSINDKGGCSITYEATVSNTGTAAGGVAIRYSIAYSGQPTAVAESVIALGAGETKTQSYKNTAPRSAVVTASMTAKHTATGAILKEQTATLNCP